MRNRQRPGLLRTVARTAVIGATATAASKTVSNAMDQSAIRAQQEQAATLQAQAEMEQMKMQLATLQSTQMQTAQAAQVAQAIPAPTPQSDLLAQLTQLAQLKEAGALSEEEFQLAKAKLLN